jgi:hypothetical protein
LRNIDSSANNHLNAAWAADDSKTQKAATGSRLKASSLLLQIIDEIPKISETLKIIST